MQVADLRRLLDAALHDAQNRISLTVTELPEGERHLRELLEGALGAGRRNGLPLSEVQLSLDRFPSLRDRFLAAPITDSGHPDVLRLIYDPTPVSSL
jgi:hypothetical protein